MRHISLAVVAVFALVGCTTSSRVPNEPPPEYSVWMVGDSLASGTSGRMVPRPPQVVSAGAGFTGFAPTRVLETVEAAIAAHGQPETMLVMAGVADTPRATTEESLAGMEAFTAAMDARGIRLVWLAEPGFEFAAQLEPLTEWVKTQPEWVDCRYWKGSTYDGVHPVDYTSMGRCVSAEVNTLGVEFRPL